MLASCFVLEPAPPPVLELVAVAATVFVVAVIGADVTTFEATVFVAVFEEAVGAADVTTCCCCCGCWVVTVDAGAELVTGAAVDGGVAVVMVEFWFDRQMPGTWRGVFSGVLQHRGDRTHLLSALRGWRRSGERARRSSGELGSAVLARGKPFLVGGVGEPPRVTIPGTTGGATLEAFGRTPGL